MAKKRKRSGGSFPCTKKSTHFDGGVSGLHRNEVIYDYTSFIKFIYHELHLLKYIDEIVIFYVQIS